MMTRLSNEEQIHKLNRECKIRLAPSKIHGIGVHALFDLPKGSRIFADNMPQVYTLAYSHFGKLFPEVKQILLERWPQIVNGSAFIYPDARHLAYMNHQDDGVANYDAFKDVTLKPIAAGEEITEDYRKIAGWEVVHAWLDKKTDEAVI